MVNKFYRRQKFLSRFRLWEGAFQTPISSKVENKFSNKNSAFHGVFFDCFIEKLAYV